tara:strand:- start:283 stop:927 length:645 start_codon:yes stop_codon:yes gene_type:complete
MIRIPIAKEGYIFIVPLGFLVIVFWIFGWIFAGFLTSGFFIFVTYFFRDPEREIPNISNVIISPADGKVVEIITETDPFLNEPFKRISIFLNVFNVHINRAPIAGRIEKVRYNPGKFLAAFNHKASLDNEQTAILFQNGENKILVKQIAGLIARRIIYWPREGDQYKLGQRFGLIRFGSRVDIFLPLSAKLNVTNGDHLAGGTSIIGFLKEREE